MNARRLGIGGVWVGVAFKLLLTVVTGTQAAAVTGLGESRARGHSDLALFLGPQRAVTQSTIKSRAESAAVVTATNRIRAE